MKLTCKSFRACRSGEVITLEVEDADSASLVPQLMTSRDVAQRLRVSLGKVGQLARSGALQKLHVGGSIRFRKTDVLQVITERKPLRAIVTELRHKR